MENRKTQKADIEQHKSTALLMGFIVALAVVFVALNWRETQSDPFSFLPRQNDMFENDAIPITHQPEFVPPKPKDVPLVTEAVNVVDNNTEVKNEEIITPEEDNSAVIEVATTVADDEATDENAPQEGSEEDAEVANIIDVMPEFPGGMVACMKFIQSRIRYPEICRQRGIQGEVRVQFIVGTDGRISDISVVKSVDQQLDNLALRIVRMMPRWKPGQRKGKPTKVKFTMPVTFIIK